MSGREGWRRGGAEGGRGDDDGERAELNLLLRMWDLGEGARKARGVIVRARAFARAQYISLHCNEKRVNYSETIL